MEINRYTELTPSQFNPLSVQEIMMVPLAKQQKHDETLDFLAQIGAADAKVHEVDREGVNAELDAFKQRSQQLEDIVLSKGITSTQSLARDIVKLKRDAVNAFSSSGAIGRSINLNKTYEENLKAIQEHKDMNRTEKARLIEKLNNDYKGTEGIYKNPNATWNTNHGWKSENIQEAAIKLGEKAKADIYENMMPVKDEKGNITGYTYQGYELKLMPDGNNYWIKDGYKYEQLPDEIITNKILPALLQDSEMKEYAANLQYLGDSPEDINKMFLDAARNAGHLLSYEKMAYDQQMRNPISGDSSSKPNFPNPSWDIVTIPIPNNKVNEINGNDVFKKIPVNTRAFWENKEGRFTENAKKMADKKFKDAMEEMSITARETFRAVGKDTFGEDFDMNNLTQVFEVKERIDESYAKYGLSQIDNITQLPTVENLGIIDALTNKHGSMNEYVKHRQGNAEYLTSSGEYFSDFNKFKKEYKIDDTPARFEGILNFDNNLPLIITKGQEKQVDNFVEPIIAVYKNNKGEDIKVFMSRAKGETSSTPEKNTRMRRARTALIEMKVVPGIKVDMNIPIVKIDEKTKTKRMSNLNAKVSYVPADMFDEKLNEAFSRNLPQFNNMNTEDIVMQVMDNQEILNSISDENEKLNLIDMINLYYDSTVNGKSGYYQIINQENGVNQFLTREQMSNAILSGLEWED